MKADELFEDNLDKSVDPTGDVDAAEDNPQDVDSESTGTEQTAADATGRDTDEPVEENKTNTEETPRSYLLSDADDNESDDDESDDAGAAQQDKRFIPDPQFAIRRERQRRRELEQEVERLRSGQTTEDDKQPAADLDDDDFLTVAQTRKLAADLIRQEMAKKEAEIARIREREQTKTRLLEAEQAFRAKTPDYDDVLNLALKEDVLLETDRRAAYQANDPAKALYLAAKRNLSLLGIDLPVPKPKPQNTQQLPDVKTDTETDDLSPEQLFNSIFK